MTTVSQTHPQAVNQAFTAGHMAYPFTFDSGRRAAQLWLATQPATSLAEFREGRWRAYSGGSDRPSSVRQAFDAGFSRALAEYIAGGDRHE